MLVVNKRLILIPVLFATCVFLTSCFDLKQASLPADPNRLEGSVVWVAQISGNDATTAHSIDVFRNGDFAVSGSFNQLVNLDLFKNTDQATVTESMINSNALFISRFSENLSFDWAFAITGWPKASRLYALEDKSLILSANYMDTSILFNGEITRLLAERNGTYILGFDVHGTIDWAITIKETQENSGKMLSPIPGFGNGFVVSGGYTNPSIITSLANGTESELSHLKPGCPDGFPGLFFARFDRNGELEWHKTPEGCAFSNAIHVIDDQNLLVAGSFIDVVTLEKELQLEEFNDQNGDCFIAHYHMTSTRANLLWSRSFIGIGENSISALTHDASNGVLVAVSFQNSVSAQSSETAFTKFTIDDSNKTHFLLTKYSADGSLVWQRGITGSQTMSISNIVPISSGVFLIGGSFTGDITLGSGEINETTMSSEGGQDGYVALYDQSGKLLWCSQVGGSYGDESVSDISSYGDAGAYILGTFQGEVHFAPEDPGDTVLTANGLKDSFLMKLMLTSDGES